ncbi:hypothetical protein AMTRI_Chr13g89890 [Amborella trichopoda]
MNPKSMLCVHTRSFPLSDMLHHLSAVRNKQGLARAFPRSDMIYLHLGALVQESRIHLTRWNVGMLTAKRKDNNRNVVHIVIDRGLTDKVVTIKRVGNRLLIKLVLGEEIINVTNAYAPQVVLEDRITRQFWEDIDGLMREVIMDFTMAYDLAITNIYFKKRDEHLITYKRRSHKSQINFFLFKKVNRPSCKDYKEILREILTTQHSLVNYVVEFRKEHRLI